MRIVVGTRARPMGSTPTSPRSPTAAGARSTPISGPIPTRTSPSVYAVSTYVGEGGSAQCPDLPAGATPPPAPMAGTVWSTDRLTVDCAGRFRLCYTLKAGDAAAPTAADCVVAETCVETWYPEPDVVQELPPLPAWTSSDSACARAFRDTGGYGETSVVGLSIECDDISDGSGGRYVFNRADDCPIRCNTDPTLPECVGCMMGGSGSF